MNTGNSLISAFPLFLPCLPSRTNFRILMDREVESLSLMVSNSDIAVIAALGCQGLSVIDEPKQIGPLPIALLNPSVEILETLTLVRNNNPSVAELIGRPSYLKTHPSNVAPF